MLLIIQEELSRRYVDLKEGNETNIKIDKKKVVHINIGQPLGIIIDGATTLRINAMQPPAITFLVPNLKIAEELLYEFDKFQMSREGIKYFVIDNRG